jgi:hypothetical protein
MPNEEEALIAEFRKVRDRYNELLSEIVGHGLGGVLRPQDAGCNVGEVCHGGSFLARPVTDRPVEKTAG